MLAHAVKKQKIKFVLMQELEWSNSLIKLRNKKNSSVLSSMHYYIVPEKLIEKVL